MATIQIECPTLGANLVAEKDTTSSLALFRGIPYASVTKRWTQSRVRDSLPAVFDATKFGPKCPKPQSSHSSMITVALKNPDVGEDEFACLNLNIAAPLEAVSEKNAGRKLLPVMVWVHGGAFRHGSNSVTKYDPQVFSLDARKAGNPIILVQINYRLNVFGFAASSDLATEFASRTAKQSLPENTPDYFSNFGLVDQHNAFQWVQNHIQDFGGDPSNVTAFGVSAGSGSLHMHILSGQPLFDRAILMSGTAPMMGPLPAQYIEPSWIKLCKNSGVLDQTSEVRLENLRSLPAEHLMQHCDPHASFIPIADDKLLPKSWRLGDAHPETRCKDIIIGDTHVEGIIFDGLIRPLQNVIHDKIKAAFKTSADAEMFCKIFSLGSAKMQEHVEFREAMRYLLSVLMFHFPNLRIAETYPGKAYLYHFEEPSPYEGKSNGLPVHGQCAVYIYGTEREVWPETSQEISLNMARLWIDFANGKEPWGRFSTTEKFMRFGPGAESGEKTLADDDSRDYTYASWLRDHFEEAKRLFFSLLG
ncbi:hypothetical protein G7Y89_g5342 [Cudoniella acicularis]|uniref:Carboxylesterase type B domain-containing protein n=1 Tax=Cudoniella acicularis TaxID=354080 RepID=A0A8H4W3G4_9HELO|nr:hypothetical protein G7Y89_g5342 [Cudoniella acicularis]